MSEQNPYSGATDQPAAAAEMQARSPYFTPRRLGATAPHDCSIWSVDYREESDPTPSGMPGPQGLRRLEDENLTEQLEILMNAGLRVRV